jgi:hypothetical protein
MAKGTIGSSPGSSDPTLQITYRAKLTTRVILDSAVV